MIFIENNINNFDLQKAIEFGIIDVSYVQEKIKMEEKKEILEKHPYKIWKGKDEKWYTYLPDKERGRILKKRTTQIALENDIIEYWKKEIENPTIEEVFNEWNDRKLELKKISSATHLRNCQIFNRHYNELKKQRIKSISSENDQDFLEKQIPKYDLTAKAFSNLKSITRGFLKRAKKRKLITFNIEEALQEIDVSEIDFKKNIKNDYEEVFNDDEYSIIIKYLMNNLDSKNIGILLMFATGIRVGELVALKHEVFNENTFKIQRTETRFCGADGKYVYEIKESPKTEAGVRTVIIPNDYIWLCSKIKALNPFGEYIFVNDKRERITTNCIRRRLERICNKLNIYKKSPHKIRKTYGSILLDNKIDRQIILSQMGHTNIICTETHYHRNRKNIKTKGDIISAIPEFQIK